MKRMRVHWYALCQKNRRHVGFETWTDVTVWRHKQRTPSNVDHHPPLVFTFITSGHILLILLSNSSVISVFLHGTRNLLFAAAGRYRNVFRSRVFSCLLARDQRTNRCVTFTRRTRFFPLLLLCFAVNLHASTVLRRKAAGLGTGCCNETSVVRWKTLSRWSYQHRRQVVLPSLSDPDKGRVVSKHSGRGMTSKSLASPVDDVSVSDSSSLSRRRCCTGSAASLELSSGLHCFS